MVCQPDQGRSISAACLEHSSSTDIWEKQGVLNPRSLVSSHWLWLQGCSSVQCNARLWQLGHPWPNELMKRNQSTLRYLARQQWGQVSLQFASLSTWSPNPIVVIFNKNQWYLEPIPPKDVHAIIKGINIMNSLICMNSNRKTVPWYLNSSSDLHSVSPLPHHLHPTLNKPEIQGIFEFNCTKLAVSIPIQAVSMAPQTTLFYHRLWTTPGTTMKECAIFISQS